jgi:hypothetical protein
VHFPVHVTSFDIEWPRGHDHVGPAAVRLTVIKAELRAGANIHEFERLDEQWELEPILEGLTQFPPLDMEYGEEIRSRLPQVYGGLSVALAKSFKIIDPHLRHPMTSHWETSFKLFDLLL